MNKRLKILLNWAEGKRNNVSFIDILKYTVKPSHFATGKTKVKSIKEEGDFFIVEFNEIDTPLYWPKEYGERCLNGVAGELLDPNHWHYYETDKTKVTPEDIVVDCGASEGLFALAVAHRCKKVYAIEPLQRFIDTMNKTFATIDNVEIIPVALSDKPGTAYMNDNDLTSTVKLHGVETEMTTKLETIDNLFYNQNRPITYLKADLEGYEIKMLEGAKKTITEYLPKIAITTYHDPEHAQLITDYLKAINPNYKIKTKGIEKLTGTPIMLHAWV